MGLLKDYRKEDVPGNVNPSRPTRGSGLKVCERCRNRFQDPCSTYLVCAQHLIHVNAGQVCQLFQYGDSAYGMG